ncbi:MAG: glycine cleavage system aminomethyltransferase GcvT [Acidobacteria bacterium]|jgi:aminomethyltransferase|nr:MAG: glycine cleavage system aminomethyltransferase GcvT [Acidobacteriota bacterium]
MNTPLYDYHVKLHARFTEFANWIMPLEYSSIKEEVFSVRSSCGIFDLCHMGRILVKDGEEKLQWLTSRSIRNLPVGRVQYNLLLNERGGVKDDITLYKLSEGEFLLCVNAVNREKVLLWLSEHGLEVRDLSHNYVQIALQGPKARERMERFFSVGDLKYYHFAVFKDVIVSRTGYTGEDGFEVYAPKDVGLELFKELVEVCAPCGLGARDVLRIEAGMPLYGHELSEEITPIEAGLDRYVSLNKDFIGKEALLNKEVKRRLYGLELLVRGVPREGYKIVLGDRHVGYVSSGTFSPTLKRGIALCFVDRESTLEGLRVELLIRGKRFPAVLKSLPFIKKPKV